MGQCTRSYFLVEGPPPHAEGWTLHETVELLELVGELGDDWTTVSNRMRTRSAEECLVHFLRLPMWDRYYCADPGEVPADQQAVPEDDKYLPFILAPDPIAAFCECVNLFDPELGATISGHAQAIVRSLLECQKSVFDEVPGVIRRLLDDLGREAARREGDCWAEAVRHLGAISHELEADIQSLLDPLGGSDQGGS